jgi:hypothetical protein
MVGGKSPTRRRGSNFRNRVRPAMNAAVRKARPRAALPTQVAIHHDENRNRTGPLGRAQNGESPDEALDTGTVASGAGIKPSEPGEALHRDARGTPCRRRTAPGPMPMARSAARASTAGAVASGASFKAGAQPRGAPLRGPRRRRRAAPLDMPRRCAGKDAGGAIGREALDAGTGGGASVKPDEPGETLHREPLDTADVPCPSTCRAAAPGPMPVAQSVAMRRAGMARWPEAPGPARNPGGRAALQAIPNPEPQIPDPEIPDFWRLQRKDIQHSGVALLLEFRCIDELVLGRRARSRRDRQILLAVDLERHRRRAEARAGIDLP